MNSYILLYGKNLKIPLLANGYEWQFKLNGIDWAIEAHMERHYAQLIFGENNLDEVFLALRQYNKKLTPADMDEFVRYFKQTHPTIDETVDIQEIPCYAIQGSPLYVPNPFGYDFWLEAKQERELMDIIRQEDEKFRSRKIKAWFFRYVDRYCLQPRYKRDAKIQHKVLAVNFCRQHGIVLEHLTTKQEAEQEVEQLGQFTKKLFKFLKKVFLIL